MSGKYLRVLYDLDYKTQDGVPVSIKAGDKCLVLKKVNNFWWNVVKNGEKIPIYVPSNYVEEIVPTVAPKPKKKPNVEASPKEPGDHKNALHLSLSEDTPIPKDESDDTKKYQETEITVATPTVPTKSFQSEDDVSETEVNECSKSMSDEDSSTNLVVKDGTSDKLQASNGSDIACAKSDNASPVEYMNLSELRSKINPPLPQEKDVTGQKLFEPVEYANLSVIQDHIHSKKKHSEESLTTDASNESSQEYTNIAELRQTMRSLPPHAPAKDAKPIKVLGEGWEEYADLNSSRFFYYNKNTHDTSWKPPRIHKEKESMAPVKVPIDDSEDDTVFMEKPTNKQVNTFGTNAVLTAVDTGEDGVDGSRVSTSLIKDDKSSGSAPMSPLPSGWFRGTDEKGESFFRNEITDEKWFSSTDDSGQMYFYKEGGDESSWQLPEITLPKRQGSVDSSYSALQETNQRKGLLRTSTNIAGSKRISLDSALAAKIKVAAPPVLPASFSFTKIPSMKYSDIKEDIDDGENAINNNKLVDNNGKPKVVRVCIF